MKLTEENKRQLESECIFSASRSSGPGGQNVNKVNTKVELRFGIEKSVVLSEKEKKRIILKLGNKINAEGQLLLFAQSSRSQLENKRIVLEKFFTLVEKALTVQKKRLKTKPTKASKLKRLESKKQQAIKKQSRKAPKL